MSLTEVAHLRAEVARLEAELAAATAPTDRTPPSLADQLADGAHRMGRTIELLSAIVDGPQLLTPTRLRAVGADHSDPLEIGMVSMGMTANAILDGLVGHLRDDHQVQCPALDPAAMVRAYAATTVRLRERLGAPKAGG